jgi:predicted RND superfamily exporter protein
VPVAYVLQRKSVGAAVLLAILFGPLGMLYATVPGALVMIVISLVLGIATAGFSVLIVWPVCIIWAAIAAQSYNDGRR